MPTALDKIATRAAPIAPAGAEPFTKPTAYEGEVSRITSENVFAIVRGFSLSRETLVDIVGPPPEVGDRLAVIVTDDKRAVGFPLGAPRAYRAMVGDGIATSIVVTHGLGTRDVMVTVRLAAAPYTEEGIENQATTEDTVTLVFGTPPTLNQFRVMILPVA